VKRHARWDRTERTSDDKRAWMQQGFPPVSGSVNFERRLGSASCSDGFGARNAEAPTDMHSVRWQMKCCFRRARSLSVGARYRATRSEDGSRSEISNLLTSLTQPTGGTAFEDYSSGIRWIDRKTGACTWSRDAWISSRRIALSWMDMQACIG